MPKIFVFSVKNIKIWANFMFLTVQRKFRVNYKLDYHSCYEIPSYLPLGLHF